MILDFCRGPALIGRHRQRAAGARHLSEVTLTHSRPDPLAPFLLAALANLPQAFAIPAFLAALAYQAGGAFGG